MTKADGLRKLIAKGEVMLADKIKALLEQYADDPDMCNDPGNVTNMLNALLAVVDFIEREPWLTNIGDRQLDVIASELEVHDG